MQDIITKKMCKAAHELYENLDKEVHIQDVIGRLSILSENYPYDHVVRNMEDIFKKRAQKNPGHIVTSEEFESVRQDLWGLNPKSAIKEYFPDLIFKKQQEKLQELDHVYADDTARELVGHKNDVQIVNEARDLVVNELKESGVHYAQTKFSKGLYTDYNSDGNPTDGILMFNANIITKAGESSLVIPVVLDQNQLIPPDTFACDAMRYPLSKKGISDFSLGLTGIAVENNSPIDYVLGDNEVRDMPTVDDSAEKMLDSAKASVYHAFRDAGVSNCQIRLASFEPQDDAGVLNFDVQIPFVKSTVKVPVTVEASIAYSPFTFKDTDGKEFELSKEGISQFLSNVHVENKIQVASRVDINGIPRSTPQKKQSEEFRSIISCKLADKLQQIGAINPQVHYVTSNTKDNLITTAFISTFSSTKGDCHIAIPVTIEGRSVKTPECFFGDDECRYALDENGLQKYIEAKSDYQPIRKPEFYGEQPEVKLATHEIDKHKTGFYGERPEVKLAMQEIDSNHLVTRPDVESRSRQITPADNRFAKTITEARESIVDGLSKMGAVNPQVQYSKREDRDKETILKFTASFQTNKGTKKAMIPVAVSEAGILKSARFLGQDKKVYDFTKKGLNKYIESSETPKNKAEAEILSKLNLLSYDQTRVFIKEAVLSSDHKQIAAGMESISKRFGVDTAKNCFADLMEEARIKQDDFREQCQGCPFYRSRNDPQSRTADDVCFKFQSRVASVQFGGHHAQCQMHKTIEDEQPFDGSIVTSQIKLT